MEKATAIIDYLVAWFKAFVNKIMEAMKTLGLVEEDTTAAE